MRMKLIYQLITNLIIVSLEAYLLPVLILSLIIRWYNIQNCTYLVCIIYFYIIIV